MACLCCPTHATEYTYDLLIGEAARALNIVFESAEKLSHNPRAQEVLVGAMKRAADDTFALRLLENTEKRDRNKILTNFTNISVDDLKAVFMERMRRRYGKDSNAEMVNISTGDWLAFQKWAGNSLEDKDLEQEFWRRFIGASRKRLAQALNFLYPAGFTWSSDPRGVIDTLFPVDELKHFMETLSNDQDELNELDAGGIVRLQELLEGKWFDITRPNF